MNECLDLLDVRPDGVYVDATLGGGGHSRAILERLGPGGSLIGLDQDADAIRQAEAWQGGSGGRFRALRGNFADLAPIVLEAEPAGVDGVLFDLGVSSHQLDEPHRGFSFRAGGPLDMRMDNLGGVTAEDIVRGWTEQEIADALRTYGEERYAWRIAKAIVRERDTIHDTADLAATIKRAVPAPASRDRIHPATKSFQALRIVVNAELEALPQGLGQALEVLRPGGRMVVISYHSLEDRLVKTTFREWSTGCICPPRMPACVCGHEPRVRLVTRKSVKPGHEEIAANPRSRSARARAVEKLREKPS